MSGYINCLCGLVYYNFLMEIPSRIKIFAGVTKRFLAFFVDVLILNIIFGVIFLILKFYGYAESNYWISFALIFILYFTLGDSIVFNGQTTGKKLLNIQLINLSGKPPEVQYTLGRSVYIAALYFNYHLIILMKDFLTPHIYDLCVVVFITFIISLLSFSTTVFMAFHPHYQGFHDVLFKSIVVIKDRFEVDHLESNYNITRLTASYFLTVVFTVASLILAIIIKLVFY